MGLALLVLAAGGWGGVLGARASGRHDAGGGKPGVKQSPPGQIRIVTINARQYPILGIRRFRAMYQLSRAVRSRPLAFDGGFFGAVHAPDVIITQEIRPSNLEIFEHILRQRFGIRYEIVSPPDSAAAIIVNPRSTSLVGDVIPLSDACSSALDDRYPARQYPIARFIEQETGLNFAVVAVHFPKNPGATGDCLVRNVNQLRTVLEVEQTPTVIAGDFNHRPVRDPYECDPNETSPPLPWWAELTAPDNGGREYTDAVRQFNRQNSIRMDYEWTHEHKAKKAACTGNVHHRRSRIDYIFVADSAVAEAHTDHPGWAGIVPGEHHPRNFKYSDHRFVWARVALGGPPKPERPLATPDAEGVIHLQWQPVDGAGGWVVYRGLGTHSYSVVERLPADAVSYDDTRTRHLRTYRYAVAAVSPEGAQGIESKSGVAVADARGPRVVSVYPAPQATGVGPGQAISAQFDEGVAQDSVTQSSIRMYVDGHRVAGFTYRKFPKQLKFNPSNPLKKGKVYRVVVSYGLRDRLGNEGKRYAWSFRTVEPPPKRPKKGRRR